MNDWRKPCEHGKYDYHHVLDKAYGLLFWGNSSCPGGSPITAADLEGLGERVWVCSPHNMQIPWAPPDTVWPPGESFDGRYCEWSKATNYGKDCRIVERLLIPIPDPQPATEGSA